MVSFLDFFVFFFHKVGGVVLVARMFLFAFNILIVYHI